MRALVARFLVAVCAMLCATGVSMASVLNHTVHRDDTVESIAKDFGVTVEGLLQQVPIDTLGVPGDPHWPFYLPRVESVIQLPEVRLWKVGGGDRLKVPVLEAMNRLWLPDPVLERFKTAWNENKFVEGKIPNNGWFRLSQLISGTAKGSDIWGPTDVHLATRIKDGKKMSPPDKPVVMSYAVDVKTAREEWLLRYTVITVGSRSNPDDTICWNVGLLKELVCVPKVVETVKRDTVEVQVPGEPEKPKEKGVLFRPIFKSETYYTQILRDGDSPVQTAAGHKMFLGVRAADFRLGFLSGSTHVALDVFPLGFMLNSTHPTLALRNVDAYKARYAAGANLFTEWYLFKGRVRLRGFDDFAWSPWADHAWDNYAGGNLRVYPWQKWFMEGGYGVGDYSVIPEVRDRLDYCEANVNIGRQFGGGIEVSYQLRLANLDTPTYNGVFEPMWWALGDLIVARESREWAFRFLVGVEHEEGFYVIPQADSESDAFRATFSLYHMF